MDSISTRRKLRKESWGEGERGDAISFSLWVTVAAQSIRWFTIWPS